MSTQKINLGEILQEYISKGILDSCILEIKLGDKSNNDVQKEINEIETMVRQNGYDLKPVIKDPSSETYHLHITRRGQNA